MDDEERENPESCSVHFGCKMGVIRKNIGLFWSILLDKSAGWLGPTPVSEKAARLVLFLGYGLILLTLATAWHILFVFPEAFNYNDPMVR